MTLFRQLFRGRPDVLAVLDEARVNRLRCLEGTDRAATRWIDTGWAIAIYQAVRERFG